MLRISAAACAAVILISTPAEAKRSNKGDAELAKLRQEISAMRRDILSLRKPDAPKPEAPPLAYVMALIAYPPDGFRLPLPPVAIVPPPSDGEKPQPRTLTTYRDHLPGRSMAGAPEPLQGWIRKVAAACTGMKVISVCRPGARVRGTGRTSLHASCRAVDFQVASPACAWGVLNKKGDRFPGGMSNDYARVRHFHISWSQGSGEWSRRFAHGGGRSYARTRYAKRWKYRARYAKRWHKRADIMSTEISAASKVERGTASHYSGGRAACGGLVSPQALEAAHKSLPCGSRVVVTNERNGRRIAVIIRDRGPFIRGRVIDLTVGAARALGFKGLAPVTVRR